MSIHFYDCPDEIFAGRPNGEILITDEHLFKLWRLERFYASESAIILPSGESAKSIDCAVMCWERLMERGCGRDASLIAVGGGAITDLAGFVAGSYQRGISCHLVPTTLLAMVDAAIGGKTGVNFRGVKNAIGLFRQPAAIHIAPTFLETLPERAFRSGVAEVVKYGAAVDKELFAYLEVQGVSDIRQVIHRCIAIKSSIVEEDFLDRTGCRAALNFGHTFAHAIESFTGYDIMHGEAVALGMSLAARVSLALGFGTEEALQRLEALMQTLQLPPLLSLDIPWPELVSLMLKDKKCIGGKIRLIVLKEIGTVEAYTIDGESLKRILEGIYAL